MLKYTGGTLMIKNKDKSDIPTNILHRVRLFISIVDDIELDWVVCFEEYLGLFLFCIVASCMVAVCMIVTVRV